MTICNFCQEHVLYITKKILLTIATLNFSNNQTHASNTFSSLRVPKRAWTFLRNDSLFLYTE